MEEDRIATLEDYAEEGKRNAIKAAEMFYQLCFGNGAAKQMEPEVWWRIHLEEVFPASLNRIRSGGSSEEEVKIYEEAFNAQLEKSCMSNAQLGFLCEPFDPIELFGPIAKFTGQLTSIESLNKHSTLSECAALGKTQGETQAREDSLRSLYRGYDFVGEERKKIASIHVGDLYRLGLSPDQVGAYISALTEAATQYFEDVSRRYVRLST